MTRINANGPIRSAPIRGENQRSKRLRPDRREEMGEPLSRKDTEEERLIIRLLLWVIVVQRFVPWVAAAAVGNFRANRRERRGRREAGFAWALSAFSAVPSRFSEVGATAIPPRLSREGRANRRALRHGDLARRSRNRMEEQKSLTTDEHGWNTVVIRVGR
jgi:hypothetical protein